METYKIHNTARAQHTRSARNAAPGRAKMKQHIGGELRVLRAVPLVITRETLEKHLKELQDKQAMGHLEVRTMDGRLVNLQDMSAAEAAPAPVAPHPPLDSANNDSNLGIGEQIPQFPGGIPTGAVPSTGDENDIPGPLGEGEVQAALQAAQDAPAVDGELLQDPAMSDEPSEEEETELSSDTEVVETGKSSKKNKRK